MPPQNLVPSPTLRRVAWGLVISMTLLLALALIAVVWGFLHQGSLYLKSREQPAPVAGGMVLPPGTTILSSSSAGGRLVLRLRTPQGEEIRIIDLASGKLVQTIKTAK